MLFFHNAILLFKLYLKVTNGIKGSHHMSKNKSVGDTPKGDINDLMVNGDPRLKYDYRTCDYILKSGNNIYFTSYIKLQIKLTKQFITFLKIKTLRNFHLQFFS